MYLKKPLKKGFPLRLTVLSEIRKFWEPLKVFRKKLTRNWQNTVKMIRSLPSLVATLVRGNIKNNEKLD